MADQKIKTVVRNAIAEVVHVSGLGMMLRRLNSRSLAILCYHRVLPSVERHDYFSSDLAVTPDTWAVHVEYLSKYFDCRTLAEAVQSLKKPERRRKPLLAITFDDGYSDCFEHARPVLESFGVRATFFAISASTESEEPPWYDRLARAAAHLKGSDQRAEDFTATTVDDVSRWLCSQWGNGQVPVDALVEAAKHLDPTSRVEVTRRVESVAEANGWRMQGRDRIMTKSQLKQLANEGHEIGSHTRTHAILTRVSYDELLDELEGSRHELETIVGCPIVSIAYPNGDYNDEVVRAALRAGYRHGVTTQPSLNDADADAMLLRRIFVSQQRTSRPDGRCSTSLLELELAGVADRVFLRRRTRNK